MGAGNFGSPTLLAVFGENVVDRIKPLKIESVGSGGTQNDEFPTSANKNEDYIDCRGVAIQDDSSDDETVLVDRDGDGNLMFKDQNNPSGLTLTQTATGASVGPGVLIINEDGELIHDTDYVLVVREVP